MSLFVTTRNIGTLIVIAVFLAGCASSNRPGLKSGGPRVKIKTRTGAGTKVETYVGIVSTQINIADARKKAVALCKKERGKSNAKLKVIFKGKGPPPFTQYGYNCF